jgi:hypothetical protein
MKSTKAILLLAMFALGVLIVPTTTVKAQGGGIDFSDPTSVESFNQYAGSIFGLFRGFGASGEMLGNVLMFMFQNFTTMNNTMIDQLPGVYVLNASKETTYTGLQFQYGSGRRSTFVPWSIYNLSTVASPDYQDETPYFVMEESGVVNYNKTEGVSVTFIIWDSDGSFI